jgi:uncharacterized membrane protein
MKWQLVLLCIAAMARLIMGTPVPVIGWGVAVAVGAGVFARVGSADRVAVAKALVDSTAVGVGHAARTRGTDVFSTGAGVAVAGMAELTWGTAAGPAGWVN